jgi:hypothetical protein
MYFIILSSNHYICYIRHPTSSNTFALAQWRILHYTLSAKKRNRFSCMRWLEQTAANIQWEEKYILSTWTPITSYMERKIIFNNWNHSEEQRSMWHECRHWLIGVPKKNCDSLFWGFSVISQNIYTLRCKWHINVNIGATSTDQYMTTLFIRSSETLQKFRSYVSVLGAREVTCSKLHAEYPHTLGTSIRNLINATNCFGTHNF